MKKKILNQILALQSHLRPLTEAQKRWAHSHYEKTALLKRGGEIWCHNCGYIHHQLPGIIDIDLECGGQCPQCGTHFDLQRKSGTQFSEKTYHTFGTTVKGWQVFRTFLAERINSKGTPTKYAIDEVYQNWISPDGKEYILSIDYSRSPFYGEKWHYSTPLNKPRKHNRCTTGYYAYNDMFDLYRNYIYPRSTFTPVLKRNGWNSKYLRERVSPAEVCKALLNPQMEMLAKTQQKLFIHVLRNEVKEIPIHSVKICNRNHYHITEPDIWLDYIANLQRLNLDTHNAHYVCPADLHAAHDRILLKVRKIREKEALEQRLAEIKKLEAAYAESKGRYFGICFGNENITVCVLQSVADIEAEGRAMHHCVFANEYYKKKDSLILSAKDKQGNRIETIEVSTKTFQLLQSRGKHNQNTPYHTEIINLVNQNMHLIQAV